MTTKTHSETQRRWRVANCGDERRKRIHTFSFAMPPSLNYGRQDEVGIVFTRHDLQKESGPKVGNTTNDEKRQISTAKYVNDHDDGLKMTG